MAYSADQSTIREPESEKTTKASVAETGSEKEKSSKWKENHLAALLNLIESVSAIPISEVWAVMRK